MDELRLLIGELIAAARERIKREQEGGITPETIDLLRSIEKLAVYL